MDTTYFRQKLGKLKATTESDIKQAQEAARPVELDQTTVGRLSRMDAMQQQEMVKAGQRRRQELLHKIEAAYKRLDEDEYGLCIHCDEEIAPKRLDLDPTVLTCIRCAAGSN